MMSPTVLEQPTTHGPRLPLAEHHRAIDAACVALRTSAFIDDPRAVIARYRNLEHAVLEHMKAEEDFLLLAYATYAPEDAAAIRDTHEELRGQLYRLGIDAELRTIRLDSIDQLISSLRAHAAHEDRALYAWAQKFLAPAVKRDVFKRISHSLRALALYNP